MRLEYSCIIEYKYTIIIFFVYLLFQPPALHEKKGAEYGGIPRFLRPCSHSL